MRRATITIHDPVLRGVRKKDTGPYEEWFVDTERGRVEARVYRRRTDRVAVLVGGVGGGFDSPGRDLYAALGRTLEVASVLRVRLRHPTDLAESVHDVRAVLHAFGAKRAALVGHSFGGAVVVQAAAHERSVVALVLLATQSFGTDPVASLQAPLLVIHGTDDTVLPHACSVDVVHRAKRAEFHLLAGAGHVLDEAADALRPLVRDFLARALSRRSGP